MHTYGFGVKPGPIGLKFGPTRPDPTRPGQAPVDRAGPGRAGPGRLLC